MVRRYNRMLAEDIRFGSEVDEELLFRDYQKPDKVEMEDDAKVDENEIDMSEEDVEGEELSRTRTQPGRGRSRRTAAWASRWSLFKLGEAEYDLLLVDESETILGQSTSLTMQSKLQRCFETFWKLLIKTPKIVVMDAYMTEGLPPLLAWRPRAKPRPSCWL